MDRASTSHGSHVVCEPHSFALKNPDRCSLPLRVTCSVAPSPGLRTAPSVTIHNWSFGLDSVMVQAVERAAWVLWNDVRRSSVHWIDSLDSRPATEPSSCARRAEQPGRTRESTLSAPMNDLIRLTVSGSEHEARVAMRCGLLLKCQSSKPILVV